jgi:hypothetical protein
LSQTGGGNTSEPLDSLAQRQLGGTRWVPVPEPFFPYEGPGQAAARQLSNENFEPAWAEGQAMTLAEALAYSRGRLTDWLTLRLGASGK